MREARPNLARVRRGREQASRVRRPVPPIRHGLFGKLGDRLFLAPGRVPRRLRDDPTMEQPPADGRGRTDHTGVATTGPGSSGGLGAGGLVLSTRIEHLCRSHLRSAVPCSLRSVTWSALDTKLAGHPVTRCRHSYLSCAVRAGPSAARVLLAVARVQASASILEKRRARMPPLLRAKPEPPARPGLNGAARQLIHDFSPLLASFRSATLMLYQISFMLQWHQRGWLLAGRSTVRAFACANNG